MAGIFITATSTGIGKTYITEQLLRVDQTHKKILSASKPIISGWPSDPLDIPVTDVGILLRAQQKPLTAHHIDAISPWRFSAPLSPDMAAEQEGKSIDIDALLAYSSQQITAAQQQQGIHLIEGVGGVMVPLNHTFTVLDWIENTGCSCILVTGSYLGTFSHTLTALMALRAKKIAVLALVVNETQGSQVGFVETVQHFIALLPNTRVFAMPYTFDPAILTSSITPLYFYITSC